MAEPWFDENSFGALYGAIVGGGLGTLGGLVGCLAGVLAPRMHPTCRKLLRRTPAARSRQPLAPTITGWSD